MKSDADRPTAMAVARPGVVPAIYSVIRTMLMNASMRISSREPSTAYSTMRLFMACWVVMLAARLTANACGEP